MPIADKAKAVFLAAMDLPQQEQLRILDTECAGDETLRRRVQAMLQAHRQADSLLDNQAAEHVVIEPPPTFEAAGTVIAGRYRLVELIGEGGMGTVWRAEQTEPVQRTVAVKLVKAGMDTKEVLARFGAERQALAVMDHPSIAKVLDGGSTEQGRPFFAMEYVPGKPITQFCRDEHVNIADRLNLFVQVCQAVQHAHQKGVIHRDLKPSNILVGGTADQPVPKVIDFGLAKATREPLTANTLHSAPGRLLGTIQYMSPEQADLDNVDIDTRTDVYALGVVLYELLTGTTPIDAIRLKKAALSEMLRMIQVEEPARPSSRIGVSARSGDNSRAIRGDLDWIVMKALEKERSRRYDSAASLAVDVNRYLHGEAVSAHPPSRTYRIRKFVSRNRVSVFAAGIAIAGLLAGVIGTSVSLIEAKRQEKSARDERDAKESARQAEAEQRALAEARAGKLEKGVEILGAIFAGLNAKADQPGSDSIGVALGRQLERAADELKGNAVGDPVTVAKLQRILGVSLGTLGHYEKAIQLIKSSVATRTEWLGHDHIDTLDSRSSLAATFLNAGRAQEGAAELAELTKLVDQKLGPNKAGSLSVRARYGSALCLCGNSAEGIPILEEIVKRYLAAGLAEDHETLLVCSLLAKELTDAGRPDDAVKLLEPKLPIFQQKLGKNHPDTLLAEGSLAVAYRQKGEFSKGMKILQRVYDGLLVKYGESHNFTMNAKLNLALTTRDAGLLDDAIVLFERLVDLHSAADGVEHPETGVACIELGGILFDRQFPDRAIPHLERGYNIWLRKDPEASETAQAREYLTKSYMTVGMPEKAVPLFEAELAETMKRKDANAEQIANDRHNIAVALFKSGQFDRAAKTDEASLAAAEKPLGADHPTILMCRNHLGECYRALGQLEDAIRVFERNAELADGKLGEKHPKAVYCRLNLLEARWEAGKLGRARAEFESFAANAKAKLGPAHSVTQQSNQTLADVVQNEKDFAAAIAIRKLIVESQLAAKTPLVIIAASRHKLGETLLAAGKYEEAEGPLRESLQLRERAEPNAWQTFATKSALGEALGLRKRYAEADRLLQDGYAGLKSRADRIPAGPSKPLATSIERLIRFYDASGQKTDADRWRKELLKLTEKK